MTSLRELITRVKTIGINAPETGPWPGAVSLLEDFWCYNHPPEDAETMSLRNQVKLMNGRYFNLNLIRVGDRPLERGERINGAAHRMREIYAAFNIGVVRINHYAITTANANEHDVIDSDAEADDLTNEWTVHNNGIDVFLVSREWANENPELVTGGLSPESGPCDKDEGKGMTGLIVTLNSSLNTTSLVMAHELGHYLGLPHRPDKVAGELTEADEIPENTQNLMYPLQVGGRKLHNDQLEDVRDHCFIFGD